MSIYLYVKKHSKTGLKYFGKTVKDPYVYNGSGVYWKKHIRRHGTEFVETLDVWEFKTKKECNEFAVNFSKQHNITESSEWANLCDENGYSGGNTYIRTDEIKQKNSQSMIGRKFSMEHRQKLKDKHYDVSGSNNPMYGKKRPGRRWYNNGIKQILVKENCQPDGFKLGML